MEALLELKKDYCQNVKIEISFLYLFHLFMYKFYYKFNIIKFFQIIFFLDFL